MCGAELPELPVAEEYEGLVLLDGTADHAADLVVVNLVDNMCKVIAGVEIVVLEEVKQVAVILVGSGLGVDHCHASARIPEFGGEAIDGHLDVGNDVRIGAG